jgi:L-fucose isomerase-like protein
MASNISRREFVGAAGMSMAALGASRMAAGADAGSGALPGYTKARVLRLFIGRSPAWPKPDLDIEAEIKHLREGLDGAPGAGDIEFVGNAVVRDAEAVKPLLQQHRDIDGILAVPFCMGTGPILLALTESGIPTISFATPYSGHEWHLVPDMIRAGRKIDVIATSSFADATAAFRQFRAIHRLKETRVLYVGGGHPAPERYVADVKAKFGTTIVGCDHKRLVEAYDAMDKPVVEAETEQWIRGASKVVEPSREEIGKSARLCLAMQKVLADEKAQAITINCLGLFGAKGLPAYPCFGFTRLNDIGLTGVCEADLLSTMTQLVYTHISGKPGFVTDPVFDTSSNTLIHAHCVAATRMNGPSGESAPYDIRSHLEDYKGAVLQTRMRVGQEITMAKLVGVDPAVKPSLQLAASPFESYGVNTMLVSTGKIVDVPNSDRGCRSQITVRVADARRMLEQWSHGLHRVIFYGDYLADTRRLGRFLGFDVVVEG